MFRNILERHTNSQKKGLYENFFLFLEATEFKEQYNYLFVYLFSCYYSVLFIPFIISIGIGKTIVEFFSAAIEVSVCKYLKSVAKS